MPTFCTNMIAILVGPLLLAGTLAAQQLPPSPEVGTNAPATKSKPHKDDGTPSNVLSPSQWRRVDLAVSRALTWLANQQLADGSFPTLDSGQPGVTSLCTMAFIAHGHVPGKGQYGAR